MRTASMLLSVLALALIGTGALAQCPAVAPVAPQCPEVAPVPQNQPIQSQCPPVVSYMPSYPALLGAGPAPALATLTGADFDRAYIQQMYELHTEISALATQGIEQTQDKNLKDLSGKIRYEQTKQNEVLAAKYRDMGLGKVPVDFSRVQTILDSLVNFTGTDYDVQYATTLSGLLMQARDAAQLGMSRLSDPRMRDQAGIVVKSTQNEITALQRWVGETTAPTVPATTTVPVTPVTPAPAGSGPAVTCPSATTTTCPPMY